MDFRATQRDVASQIVLALEGSADLAALPRVHDAIQRLLASLTPASTVAVELDGVTVLDDAALGLLLGAAAAARSHDSVLYVVCADPRIRQRLTDTRFDRVVDVVSSIVASSARPARQALP